MPALLNVKSNGTLDGLGVLRFGCCGYWCLVISVLHDLGVSWSWWWVIFAVGVWWDLGVGRWCGCWWFWQLVILAIHNPSHLGKVAPGVHGDQMVPGAEHSHTSLLIYVRLNHSSIRNDGAKTTFFFYKRATISLAGIFFLIILAILDLSRYIQYDFNLKNSRRNSSVLNHMPFEYLRI